MHRALHNILLKNKGKCTGLRDLDWRYEGLSTFELTLHRRMGTYAVRYESEGRKLVYLTKPGRYTPFCLSLKGQCHEIFCFWFFP